MSFPFTVPLSQKEVVTPTSNQRAPLGTRGATADGRVFRYSKNGSTALAKGYLVSVKAHTTQWGNSTAGFWDTDHSANTAFAGATSIAAGTTFVNLSATCDSDLYVAKDHFKEGWLIVSGTSTQSGQMMKIKTHNVASSGSTGYQATGGKLYVEFEDGYSLVEAIDSADEVSMIENEFYGLVVTPTQAASAIVGASVSTVSADYYFWCQTWGIAAIKSEAEAITAMGGAVCNSTQTAGTIQGVTGSTDGPKADASTGAIEIVGKLVSSSGLSVLEASTFVFVNLTLNP